MSSLRIGVACGLGVLLCACPGRLEDPERFTNDGGGATDGGGTACDVPNTIFAGPNGKCAFAGCHGTMSPQPTATPLDLETTGVAARLRQGKGSQACSNAPLITLMRQKVRPSPPCGAQMPLGLPLSAAEITCLDAYLDAVADGGNP